MYVYVFIVFVLLIIILFTTSKSNNIEGFTTFVFDKIPPFNGEDYYDTLFDDVTYYPNEIDPGSGLPTGLTGYSMCKYQCKGNCMEYGETGNSYCFPY